MTPSNGVVESLHILRATLPKNGELYNCNSCSQSLLAPQIVWITNCVLGELTSMVKDIEPAQFQLLAPLGALIGLDF